MSGHPPNSVVSYVGRFAPSPTGPLHFGSLIAATASYLDAKCHGGKWLIRIEDVDQARCRPEWAADILRTLESLGFEWDGEIVNQSSRVDRYEAALEQLQSRQLLYACLCSRKEIGDSAVRGIEGPVYPGTCRNQHHASRGTALRIVTDNDPVEFEDRVQGRTSQRIESEIGDFILKRKDGFHAYQLAVVVDDALQAVTHVVRGADLLDSTSRQIYLQRRLGYPVPAYLHFPVAVNELGQKLSKQTFAAGLDGNGAKHALLAALRFLGQDSSDAARAATNRELLTAAVLNWKPGLIPARRDIPAWRVPSA
jgi:glutamyl-Q tRNA(Asp) synthetase